jgi:hypothetical protein
LCGSVLSERIQRDRGKGSGAVQSGRIQKGKGYYGQCVHPGPCNKERIKKERGRMYALFVDCRAAFEEVDTGKMFECTREREE